MSTIGKMNRRIVCVNYTNTKSATGGVVLVAQPVFEIWAQVEDRSGSFQNSQQNFKWVYDYKVTVRFRGDISSLTVFQYNAIKMQISNLTIVSEGKNNFLIAQCSKITP